MYYFFYVLDDILLGVISSLVLLVSGAFYITIHFGCRKGVSAADVEEAYEETYRERLV